MVIPSTLRLLAAAVLLALASNASAQQLGSIRGMVFDKDFDAPLPLAQISIAETGQKIAGTEQGNFVFPEVPPGTYTLVISKEGYTRQVRSNVVVAPGQVTELEIRLSGDLTEMEEFVVQDVQLGTGTEAGLLALRLESPALMDSISADLMSRAGASDAAAALNLVSGATVQDGKYAVIRGLPDRYVSSQMNGVRLPTADPDKRAVELDQFPSAVIESIQVSKTFTPDQQGDASGGAVNVVLKGIPTENIFQFNVESSVNTQVAAAGGDFLTYRGGGVNFLGNDRGDRDIQPAFNTADGGSGIYNGAVGVSRDEAPIDYKWSLTAGGKHEFDNGVKIGGLASIFYERDSSYYDDGIDDALFQASPGGPMTPQYYQGDPSQGQFKTALLDVTQGSEEVKWGGLTTLGIETERHKLKFIYLLTRATEDVATLAEDTRGKEYFFLGYNPNDPFSPGFFEFDAAPYLRNETLSYTERGTSTMQVGGEHTFPIFDNGIDGVFKLLDPTLDWTVARSDASLVEPDKRQFGTMWLPGIKLPGAPPALQQGRHQPTKAAENFTLGNLQRTWKDITEESEQYFANFKVPFTQWTETQGYFKFGVFYDFVTREYNQDSFSNFGDNGSFYRGEFDDLWSQYFPYEVHPVTAANIDVDYTGEQNIDAWYWMADVPFTKWFKVIGGIRYENTELSIVNSSESEVTWIPPGSPTPVQLNPGDADVFFKQKDMLPSIGFQFDPFEKVTFRGSYTETVARQTFKELSPIQQQEYLGADVFIGNPELQMSALKNYDLRLDYRPFEESLISVSWFYKDIKAPIEYVQRYASFNFTFPVNYPEGKLSGWEFEVRQGLGVFREELQGLSIGGNATLIESEVTLPADEAASLAPFTAITTRDMTNAPEFLYNVYVTYDLETTGTRFGLFYTVRGDTLIAGTGFANSGIVPDVYEKEYGTLNFSLIQKLGEHFKFKFQAKNLTNPDIEEVYRSSAGDYTKTSYTKGIDFTFSISAEFNF